MTLATAPLDYRPVLERALGVLPECTAEARQAVYRRARAILDASLRDADPPVEDQRGWDERLRLEQVIEDVERQFAAPPSGGSDPTLGWLTPAGKRDVEAPKGAPAAARKAERKRGGARRFSDAADPTMPAILEFQRPSAAIVNVPMPLSARSVIYLVTSLVVAMIVLAGVISVDQVVTARGIVVSRSPTLLVQPLETAIVRSINAIEGEQVRKGQVLATLDPTFASADAGALFAQVASLGAETARLSAEENGQPFVPADQSPDELLQASIFGHRQSEFRLKVENYRHKIDELTSVMAKAQTDIDGYAQRLEVAQSVEGIRKTLEAKQLGSKLNTLAAVDARAEMQRARANAEDQLRTATRDRDALRAESQSYAQSWKADVSQKLSEAMRKLSDATESLNKAKLRQSLVELRADQDGIVQSMAKVSVGSVLQSGQPFITLVPTGAMLEIEANVAGDQNGFVHVGDPVSIKFDTFPFSQYGLAEGRVRAVSPNSFTAQDEMRNPTSSAPVASNEPFYRARISLDRIKLHGTPPGFKVIPGMPTTADIKVGRRTVLNYFLGRVLPIAQEGLREPQT